MRKEEKQKTGKFLAAASPKADLGHVWQGRVLPRHLVAELLHKHGDERVGNQPSAVQCSTEVKSEGSGVRRSGFQGAQ